MGGGANQGWRRGIIRDGDNQRWGRGLIRDMAVYNDLLTMTTM